MRQKGGFTLIEVLTVMVIIGILVSLTSFIYSSALKTSRDSQRISDLAFIQNALEQFYLDNRSYPEYTDKLPDLPQATFQLESGRGECQQNTKKYLSPRYVGDLPQDPAYKLTLVYPGCSNDPFGQYLYYGLPKGTSKEGYYLMARVEKASNVNYDANKVKLTENGYNSTITFCNKQEFEDNPTVCSQNYFVTND